MHFKLIITVNGWQTIYKKQTNFSQKNSGWWTIYEQQTNFNQKSVHVITVITQI